MCRRRQFFRLLLSVFSLLSLPLLAQQYWSQVPNSPAGTTRHDDIYFANEQVGWSTKGTLIYKTTNGGTNWTQKFSHAGTHFRSIGFATTNRGWAGNLGAGSYDGTVTDTNVLYETFDGGDTWSAATNLNGSGMQGFCAMHVLDAQHVYGVGRVRGPAYFVKTTDLGTNWTVVNLTAQGVMNGLMDVYFKDPTNGFVVGMDTNAYSSFTTNCSSGYHGRIARTRDGGATWTPVVTTTLTCCYFWKMSWPSPNVCYVSLQQNGTYNDIIFYKSVDGGETFTEHHVPLSTIGSPGSFYLQGIGFVSEEEGWMGGNANAFPYNFIHTTNGGLTWLPVGYNNTTNINRIRFLSPILGYASGAKIQFFHAPLALTNQPASLTKRAGETAVLEAKAIGNAPIVYQWKKDGIPVTGGTNAVLTLTNLDRTFAGNYTVTVTNAGAAFTSSNAVLRVLAPTRIETVEPLFGRVSLLLGDAAGGNLNSNDLNTLAVQGSSNLLQWQDLTNDLTLTNGRVRFEDGLTNPVQFYRVIGR